MFFENTVHFYEYGMYYFLQYLNGIGIKTFDSLTKKQSQIISFIEFKNALGIQYKSASCYLKQLDIYNYEHGNHSVLIKEVVEGWAMQHAAKSTTGDRSWVSPIREFGRYLKSIGVAGAYVTDLLFSVIMLKSIS